MSSSVLALALLLLAASDPGASRKAFSQCLRSFAQSSLAKKLPADQFDQQVGAACSPQEQEFRRTVVTSDVARGISRKTSEQGVADEIADYIATAKENYRADLGAS